MPRRPLGISITALLLALVAGLAFPRLASMSALERAPLTKSAASAASAPAQASVLIATATVNVNLRASPSTAAARKRLVVAGEPLVVLDAARKDWYGVRSVEGLEGWVMAQYVTLSYQTSAPTVASVQAAFGQPSPAPVAAPAAAPAAAPVAPAAVPVSAPVAPAASAQPAPFYEGVTGVGDSIMLGAAGYLREAIGPMDINAVVGRQTSGAIEALRWQIGQGRLASTVIVHIGTNGTITPDQFDQIMGLVGQRHVVFVNVRVPRSWEGSNNWLLTYKVAQYPNASLVDWYGVAAYRPDFFLPDGIHLNAAGKQAYAAVIAAHLAAR